MALFAASPIPYHVPLYRRLASDPRIELTVIFASNAGLRPHDPGYGQAISWDVDLLKGYRTVFLKHAGTNGVPRSFIDLRDIDVVGELVRGRYEVLWLHGYNSLTHQLASWTQTLRGRPVLFREEQTLIHPRPWLKRGLKAVLLRVLFHTGFALYIGSQNRHWFERYGVPAARLFFVPYCVDNERLQSEASKLLPLKADLRRQLGLSSESGPAIITVSRLLPQKQPLFILEAFRLVRRRIRCSLLVAGSGELTAELHRRIKEEHIPDVHLMGFVNQSQISKAYAAADVFVLASRLNETWGVVVNEAMNFALPVVVSDNVGSGADLVMDGHNGFVVPHDDVNALAEKLGALVSSPQRRQAFGAASKQLVARWSVDVAADGALRAIECAVGRERWSRAMKPGWEAEREVGERPADSPMSEAGHPAGTPEVELQAP